MLQFFQSDFFWPLFILMVAHALEVLTQSLQRENFDDTGIFFNSTVFKFLKFLIFILIVASAIITTSRTGNWWNFFLYVAMYIVAYIVVLIIVMPILRLILSILFNFSAPFKTIAFFEDQKKSYIMTNSRVLALLTMIISAIIVLIKFFN